jgi:hypothetical protein
MTSKLEKAFHEAGHAVAARALGVTVEHISMRPTADSSANVLTWSAFWMNKDAAPKSGEGLPVWPPARELAPPAFPELSHRPAWGSSLTKKPAIIRLFAAFPHLGSYQVGRWNRPDRTRSAPTGTGNPWGPPVRSRS